jgi:glycosyltransferase involved in cell wall biosynthesis
MKKVLQDFLVNAEVVGEIPQEKVELLVVVLSFNQADYISEAIKSVTSQQNCSSYKIIICDDASNDNSSVVIRQLVENDSSRIFAVLQRENKFSKSVNILEAVQCLCPSDFIARLDADDYWLSKEKLSRQLEYMKRNANISISAHTSLVLNQEKKSYSIDKMKRTGLINSKYLSLANFISTGTVMYRTEKLLPLPEEFTKYYIQDWPLYAVLASRGDLHFFDDILSVYRVHSSNGYALKKNSDFLKDTLGINRMLMRFLPGNSSCLWRIMLLLRTFFGYFDFVSFGKASTVLNKICALIVGISRKPIGSPD